MNKLFYPAIFHTAEEGGFWITFPDFPECITEGDDMEDAYRMDKAEIFLKKHENWVNQQNKGKSAVSPVKTRTFGTSTLTLLDTENTA